MTDLVHYYAVPSRGMVTHWMLEELGVPYENRRLDIGRQENRTPEFLAINPLGRVPALVHGDVVVTETAAIVTYLAAVFPEAGLGVTADSPDYGAYLRWLFFAPVTVESTILWETIDPPPAEGAYRPVATVDEVAATLAEAVRGKRYIVGDRFTAADVMIGTTIMWGTRLMPLLPPLPELLAYWEGLEQREAWQRAFGEDQALMQN